MNEQQTDSADDEVVFVVTRRIRPGCEQKFQQWLDRISKVEATLPGFLGREDIPPLANGQDTWTHVIRFASPAAHAAWFEADAYKALIDEVRPLCAAVHRSNPITGFGSWFSLSDQAEPGAVPAWKQTLVVVLSLYPSIYLISWAFTSHVNWPFAMKLLASNVIAVSVVSWITLPFVRRCVGWWMPRSPNRSRGVEIGMATLIIAVLLGLMLVFNWMSLV